MKSTYIGGLNICCASRQELAEHIVLNTGTDKSTTRRPKVMFDANGHGISLYSSSPTFRSLMDQADVIHADGGFLVTASRLLTKNPIAERSATTDLIHDIARIATSQDSSFFLLGGTEEVNSKCHDILLQEYPRLRIAGRNNGYFDDEPALIEKINASGADILWVGLGKPLEQEFCMRNRDHLNCRWIITCGGCYNYITGDYARAPLWMQESNLEWLHRLATNPRKLFWRYAVTTPHALWLTVWHSVLLRGLAR